MNGESKLFTIIICTVGREALLTGALDSLLTQSFPKERYEILIVDDSTHEKTLKLAERYQSKYPNIKYTKNSGRGLLKARFTGQSAAIGQYVGYFDDDAKACSDWLQRAATIIDSIKPVCFGGPFFPFYISKKPDWYKDEYGSMTKGDVARNLWGDEVLCGGNIFFHRESLIASGGFDPDFTKAGERWTYGDEEVPQRRLKTLFPRSEFFYDPQLYILHLVRPERLNIFRSARECFAMGRAHVKVNPPSINEIRWLPFLRRSILCFIRFICMVCIGLLWRDRNQFKHLFSYVYEVAFIQLRGAGSFYETYKILKKRVATAQI